MPVDVNVQLSVALPDPVRLAGETEQNDVVLVARLTIPENPSTLVIVIVEVPVLPLFTVTLVGLALIEKF